MRTVKYSILGILLLILINADATLLRCNNSGVNAPFTTLSAALAAASAVEVDTIIVEHSTVVYIGSTISKEVVIFGTGFFLADNPQTQADTRQAIIDNLTFAAGSEGSRLSGVEIADIVIDADDVVIFRNNITNSIRIGVGAQASSAYLAQNFIRSSNAVVVDALDCPNLVFTNNFCESTSTNGADKNFQTTAGTGLILNNLFFGIPQNVFKNMTIEDNYFHDSGFDPGTSTGNAVDYNTSNLDIFDTYPGLNNVYLGDLGGGGILANAPDTMFLIPQSSSTDGRYQLSPWIGNPLDGTSSTSGDRGIFGGLKPYILSGMPPIPSIYEYTGQVTGTTGGGVNSGVKSKSRN